MTRSFCHWAAADVGLCLRFGTGILHAAPDAETLRPDDRSATLHDRSLDEALSMTLDDDEVVVSLNSGSERMARVRTRLLGVNPLADPRGHADLVADLLLAAGPCSEHDEAHLEHATRADGIADLLTEAGGAIAAELGAPSIVLAPPTRWHGGTAKVGDDPARPLPDHWTTALRRLVPPLHSIGCETAGTAGEPEGRTLVVGPAWKLCFRADDPVAAMRLLRRAA